MERSKPVACCWFDQSSPEEFPGGQTRGTEPMIMMEDHKFDRLEESKRDGENCGTKENDEKEDGKPCG